MKQVHHRGDPQMQRIISADIGLPERELPNLSYRDKKKQRHTSSNRTGKFEDSKIQRTTIYSLLGKLSRQ